MRAQDDPTPLVSRTPLTDRLGWLGLRSGQILLVILLSAVVIYGLVQLKLVVIPVLIAIILAAALSPVINGLRRRGVAAILATWITLLGGIAFFGGIITLIVFAVRDQWNELFSSASQGIDRLQQFLIEGPIQIDEKQIDDARTAVVDFLTSSQFGTGALAGASVVFELVTGAVLLVVILFFFLKDGDQIWNFFLTPFKGERLARGRRIGQTSLRVLGGYVRGTAIVAAVDATAIGVGLAILQVPLALPLAVIVFLGAFIPLIGATAAGVLAALVALVASGPGVALIVIIIVIAVNQLEGNFLQPVVMAQSLKLHPLVILVGLTAGTILGGIVGAVLSVPIAAVAWAIAKAWHAADVPRPRAIPPKRRVRKR
ncbi:MULTISPECIES: AI-2E family transporter [Cryobacterium]|uniref:AI-2E family transporter n=1 Tax=Cryobacterium gelidum TaxID=1259164 RepID=A0A4R9B2G8_9MICO|nr:MULTISPECIES: AI-2E family transporter [Cryobacterium]TFB65111.1 AI-2E family transporter [Cryobacterium sp. Hz9]TFD73707.1 AI-2E family transporter [Cryobacterium gelidum]